MISVTTNLKGPLNDRSQNITVNLHNKSQDKIKFLRRLNEKV